ncbi:MAG: Ig-like domain-containing protein, partial [Bacillota bacterium]|nr:Ig-like domain-containing protein [Bacillota bacterium]
MKTKFFKKLSFVLVVAMVLSVFAPAASVFAAKKPALNSTKKYLHLGRVDNGQNEFNFNIKNKQKGSKYQWESSNEAIAVVNEKNGVTTAKGVGKATISVTITDKDGKDTTLKAQVIVRDNIETVKISNPVEKVGVGEAYDYNRSFITEAGSTKKTSAITRWEVEPNTATIDDKGVFVATEPGEYTVTALSFQSKARYNSWLEDADKYADYVLDTDTTKVVVAGSIKEVKQESSTKVKVVFDTAMPDADKNITLYQIIGESKAKQITKEIKLADDKKSVTVETYVPFKDEATYEIDYPEVGSDTFVAARRKAEDVAEIKIETSTAVVGEATDVVVKLFNSNNVDITDGDGLDSRIKLSSDNEVGTYLDGDQRQVIIFEKGATTKVTATFHSYEWDTTTGEEIGN